MAAGLLSVALPWLALTSLLFTENLAYPLFWWALLAMVAAASDPRPARDAAVVLAIGLCLVTRVQLSMLLPAWVLAIATVQLVQARTAGLAGWDAAMYTGRRFVRSLPFTVAGAGRGTGRCRLPGAQGDAWRSQLDGLLGAYSNEISLVRTVPLRLLHGPRVSRSSTLALGVGVLPAVAALAWYPSALAPWCRRRDVVLSGSSLPRIAIGVVFMAATVHAQFGYLGPQTEER